MKKQFLVLPIAVAVLSACSSNTTPAPVESVDGSLSPGIMQSVDNSTVSGAWQPEVQPSTMPMGMNDNVVSNPVANQVNMPQPKPVVTQPIAKPVQKTVPKAQVVQQKVSQNFEIPRNPQTNAPDYSKIDKGFYKGDTYTVRKGDTMFLIAYISGLDVRELARLNNMSEPYTLAVGQTLKVSNNTHQATQQVTAPQTAVTQQPAVPAKPVEPEVTYTQGPNGTQYGSDGSVKGPIKAGTGSATSVTGPIQAGVGTATTTPSTPNYASNAPAVSNINWQWPTAGKVVQGFSNVDGGNKGIDISGSKGQPVYAAAAGRVVYAGNALRGYGNLIIIKHSDDYLSAYAHNDSITVSDQQEVKAGQQIAKMGNTGTNSVKLHFEIRYKGQSVDPTRYLPRR